MFNLCNLDTMSRLSIEIDPESHRQIKTLATFAGMTIKDYILAKTLPEREQGADATEQLLKSPKNAARLRDAIASPQSGHVAFESIEELKDALGISGPAK
jgi:hypothetical protein